MSDLHGQLPEIPECDVLVLAGDLFPDRLPSTNWARFEPECQGHFMKMRFLPWLRQGKFIHAVGTYGNHDYAGLHPERYLTPHDPLELLVDQSWIFQGVKFWFSPWSRLFMDWAFMKDEVQLAAIYSQIPDDTNVLVSHQPPYGYCDTIEKRGECLGSIALLDAMKRVKPEILICGHIHGGYGKTSRLWYGGDSTQPAQSRTQVFNVSVVNESYKLVHPATIIDIP